MLPLAHIDFMSAPVVVAFFLVGLLGGLVLGYGLGRGSRDQGEP